MTGVRSIPYRARPRRPGDIGKEASRRQTVQGGRKTLIQKGLRIPPWNFPPKDQWYGRHGRFLRRRACDGDASSQPIRRGLSVNDLIQSLRN
jgi:hypothetical protein